jgi:iron-sulfur cluster repair protein YtfE (RIC family)
VNKNRKMPMLATEMLLAHHNELRALMTRLVASLDAAPQEPADRRRVVGDLLEELTDELLLHEMIEDAIFYPAMRDVSALVSVAHPEHRQIADQLATVLRTPTASNRFAEEFAALRAAVEHHASQEEQQMFPEVQRKISHAELERVGHHLTANLERLRGSRLTRLRLRLKRQTIRHAPSKKTPGASADLDDRVPHGPPGSERHTGPR